MRSVLAQQLCRSRPLRTALTVCLALSVAAGHAAVELAQKPLIASAGSTPKPNLMLTVDTSGSMARRHMPEGLAKVNGQTLPVFGGVLISLLPGDTYEGSSTWYFPAVLSESRLTNAQRLSQIYGRSPMVNSVYYDPRVRYRPWVKSPDQDWGTTDGRYPQALFGRAYTNPLLQPDVVVKNETLFLTQNCAYAVAYATALMVLAILVFDRREV